MFETFLSFKLKTPADGFGYILRISLTLLISATDKLSEQL